MRIQIIKMNVDVSTLNSVVHVIINWSFESKGKYVCVTNVHMCMEAFDDYAFCEVVNNADLAVADGKPIVWAQKLLGLRNAKQVRGTDLTLSICREAEKAGISIGFFGSTDLLLRQINTALINKFPKLIINYRCAPPFRDLTKDESDTFVQEINDSEIKILFVGLGCPKQEKWMAEHKDKLSCTMLGVGAAFDFIAGNKRHAPIWMQWSGLEWLYRLASEPRRLWKRYLKHNPRFVYYLILQILGRKYV